MGSIVASLRLQGRCQALSNQPPLVASVVPDVSGIDKVFDYVVPAELAGRASVGARVRINLNGRRVSGWIVSLGPYGTHGDTSLGIERLAPLVSVSGLGVEPEIVSLTQWVATRWWGPWRATLSSASAPRVTDRHVHSRRGVHPIVADDAVSIAARQLASRGGGLLVVPPLSSALAVVSALATDGPVLAICPTHRMAAMGAAALRRRGFSTAIIPDEWENARGGVDVVIGARSAVFAPCPEVSSIIVIDEHDESLHEERSPTWDATTVAIERARAAGVPIIVTSAVPSAGSEVAFAGRRDAVESDLQWPHIEVVNLNDVPVASSLLSSQLFESIAVRGSTTVVVLNTKGKARLIVCKSCRAVQSCTTCNALLTQGTNGELRCDRCDVTCGSVCVSCGRSAFIVPRGGVSQLRTQLQASSANPVIEITADTSDEWTKGNVFIGTEAVLHRVTFADCVVFADIDRDLGAPRMSAPHEVLALIARAARTVGSTGKVVVQTRQMEHPLMVALQSPRIADALRQWAEKDLAQRRILGLPPFGVIARVIIGEPHSIDEVTLPEGIQIAREEGSVLVRALSHETMDEALRLIRTELGTSVRIHMNPRRF